jgi:hypothetical protein
MTNIEEIIAHIGDEPEDPTVEQLVAEVARLQVDLYERDRKIERLKELYRSACKVGELRRLECEEITRKFNELRECGDGLREYVEWNGGVHARNCPEDDTCDCHGRKINDAVNKLCCNLQPLPKAV